MELPLYLSVVFGLFTLVTVALMIYNSKNVTDKSESRKSVVKMLILIGVSIPICYLLISNLTDSKNWELIAFQVLAIIWGLLLIYYLYDSFKSKSDIFNN